MTTVSEEHLKEHLSELLDRAAQGETIRVERPGAPAVLLQPQTEAARPRVAGQWKGKVWIADDFDELPQEIQDAFEGKLP